MIQVRKSKYEVSDSAAAIAIGDKMTEGKASIFRYNPGKTKTPYPPKHPYMPTGCGDCDKVKLAYNPNKASCRACKYIEDDYNYENIPTQNGKVRIHKKHGKAERVENIEIASYLANKHGYEIDLLERYDDKKSPDSYNKSLGDYQEYKSNNKGTINSVDRSLRDAYKQTNNIVIKINSDISMTDLSRGIIGRVKRSNIKEIILIKDNKDITFTREEIISHDFIIKQEDFK